MRQITNLFALWTVLGTAWAWFVPGHFTWFVDSENRIVRHLSEEPRTVIA